MTFGMGFSSCSAKRQYLAIKNLLHNGVETVAIDYPHLVDSTDPQVRVTNALGKQTIYHFTTIPGVRKVTQVEGHQSTNCAAANKAYPYDPNGNELSRSVIEVP